MLVSGEVPIHPVDFNTFGVMAPIPDYQSGHLVDYGGMVYRPLGRVDPNSYGVSGALTIYMGHVHGDYGDGVHGWGGDSLHEAQMWYRNGVWMFYCS